MSTAPGFTLHEAGLDIDFLRRMYFDCGNYFYAQKKFDVAADMFLKSFYYSVNRHDAYLRDAQSYDVNDINSDLAFGTVSGEGSPAPGYYSIYNYVCCRARLGTYDLSYLEMALRAGFPKKEYGTIRTDPDLADYRQLWSVQFSALLERYAAMK